MIRHTSLGDTAFKRRRNLKVLINKSEVTFAGNLKLKIYGTLNCSSGKRMKPENRVFFSSETEAIALGYRPCGHCLLIAYKNWLIELD
ncbi:MAG TPA: Ada metal-binding domain-containing protein [Mucilaginibacter sp.]|jgi:methylphosphotriester-DNA--protein-cysteine methyltransferase|nr:Ada metal-binding domain-containing protein [Mucilaginibacter sp.]